MAKPRVHVSGLRDLRSALKAIDPKLQREVNRALRDAVQPMAGEAKREAPKLRGALARSVRAGATAKGAFIGARAPHAGVHEFGGTIRFITRRAQIRIDAQPYLRPAVVRGADDAIDRISDAIDELTARHGFR